MHHAARRGRGAAVATLLAARAKLEKQDAQGHTPLIAAAAAGRADTATLTFLALKMEILGPQKGLIGRMRSEIEHSDVANCTSSFQF